MPHIPVSVALIERLCAEIGPENVVFDEQGIDLLLIP